MKASVVVLLQRPSALHSDSSSRRRRSHTCDHCLRAVLDSGRGGQAHVRRDSADVLALGQFVSESYS